MDVRRFVLLFCVLSFGCTQAIRFDVDQEVRCVKDELRSEVVVVGNFVAEDDPRMLLKFWLRDPAGKELYVKDGNEGTFGITTELAGEYAFCFQDNVLEGRGTVFAGGIEMNLPPDIFFSFARL